MSWPEVERNYREQRESTLPEIFCHFLISLSSFLRVSGAPDG